MTRASVTNCAAAKKIVLILPLPLAGEGQGEGGMTSDGIPLTSFLSPWGEEAKIFSDQ